MTAIEIQAKLKLTDEQFEQFDILRCHLSPENLHCDGEITRAQANRRYRNLMAEWRDLEREVGHEVSEEDVYLESYWRRELAKVTEVA